MTAIARVASALLMLAWPSSPANAWSHTGHYAIGAAAQALLADEAPAVERQIRQLLAADETNTLTAKTMADDAFWADAIEKDPTIRTATRRWHFVLLAFDAPDLTAACHRPTRLPNPKFATAGQPNDCIVTKITQFADEVHPGTPPAERLVAVRFLLHLVGDVHQPLHTIDRADQGGNCTAIQLPGGEPVSLHAYWDDHTVRSALAAQREAAGRRLTALVRQIPPATRAEWIRSSPDAWALESHQAAKATAYRDITGASPARRGVTLKSHGDTPGRCPSIDLYTMKPDYAAAASQVALDRMQRAAVRLAHLLATRFH